MMRCIVLAATLVLPLAGYAAATDDTDPRVWLWPNEIAPGSEGVDLQQIVVERSSDPELPDRYVAGITRPYLTVHQPPRPNGAALLVTPGGGYQRIVLDKEGTALLPAFVEAGGATVFLLRYRLPAEGHDDARNAPLADAQRALRLIRARASEWGVDPGRIGVMGFSAGGHVAASLGTRFDETVYTPVDAIDRHSARPDFMLLVYPVIDMGEHAHPGSRERLLGAEPTAEDIAAYSPQHRVGPDAPPAFLLHATDDATVTLDNSLLFFNALRLADVPAELHVYPRGGHGFGVREARGPLADWPRMALDWIRAPAEP